MKTWYVRAEGNKVSGPVSEELVVRGILAGKVPVDAKVLAVGDEQWRSIAVVAQFGDAIRQVAPPPESLRPPPMPSGRPAVAWYVRTPGGRPLGPVGTEELMAMVRQQELLPKALVCRVGERHWRSLEAEASLAADARRAPREGAPEAARPTPAPQALASDGARATPGVRPEANAAIPAHAFAFADTHAYPLPYPVPRPAHPRDQRAPQSFHRRRRGAGFKVLVSCAAVAGLAIGALGARAIMSQVTAAARARELFTRAGATLRTDDAIHLYAEAVRALGGPEGVDARTLGGAKRVVERDARSQIDHLLAQGQTAAATAFLERIRSDMRTLQLPGVVDELAATVDVAARHQSDERVSRILQQVRAGNLRPDLAPLDAGERQRVAAGMDQILATWRHELQGIEYARVEELDSACRAFVAESEGYVLTGGDAASRARAADRGGCGRLPADAGRVTLPYCCPTRALSSFLGEWRNPAGRRTGPLSAPEAVLRAED